MSKDELMNAIQTRTQNDWEKQFRCLIRDTGINGGITFDEECMKGFLQTIEDDKLILECFKFVMQMDTKLDEILQLLQELKAS